MFTQLSSEIRAIIRGCLELSWYSRGAWSYESILNMSAAERDIAKEFIESRLESQSKSMFPIY